jgi:hypothetical protein
MVTDSFSKWALGFSGCDGGNPKGKIWICGIEYGGNDTEETLDFTEDVSQPRYLGGTGWPHSDFWNPELFVKGAYNWKTLKLLCGFAGESVTQYRCFFKNNQCFYRDSDYFKLNLYPLAFRDVSPGHWQPWLTQITGFQNKGKYEDWCKKNRFKVLKQWAADTVPRLIVCTGMSRQQEFLKAFCNPQDQLNEDSAANKSIKYVVTNNGATLVAVIYFFGGRYGLNSDLQLGATGKRLSELVDASIPVTAPSPDP